MKQSNSFVAEILERSAAGYGGCAAGILLDQHPEIAGRYAPDAFEVWKSHLTQRVIELAAALAAGDKRLFTSRLIWSGKAFLARDRNINDLLTSLRALRHALQENLPTDSIAECIAYIDAAVDSLNGQVPALDQSELDPRLPRDKLALRYLTMVLEGDVADAIAWVTNESWHGLGAADIYVEVLLPAQREIGRLWHLGDVTVAEEHLVTATTQRAMAVLANNAGKARANGRTMIAAAVSGNTHDIGLRAVTDLYQFAGWRAIFVGSDVPIKDLPACLTFFEADLLLLGATLSTQIQKSAEAIRIIRDRCERDVRIIVGGAAFDEAPDLWRRLGADGYGSSVDEAVAVGERLVAERTRRRLSVVS